MNDFLLEIREKGKGVRNVRFSSFILSLLDAIRQKEEGEEEARIVEQRELGFYIEKGKAA